MKSSRRRLSVVLFIFAVAVGSPAGPLHAQDQKPPPSKPPASAQKTEQANAGRIEYAPPRRGAPAGRIGGGTRGSESRELSLAVVAPEQVGLSSTPSPRLYWFVSRPISSRVEVTVIEDGAMDPILERVLPPVDTAGVQSVDLAALGVALKPGREYRWFVSLLANPNARSSDTVASGKVLWEAMPPEIRARVESATGEARAAAFAAGGYWYDAYAELRSLREARPLDARLREIEVALVSQVNLPDVARHLASP